MQLKFAKYRILIMIWIHVFEPLYQVLDTLNPTEFKGIQGIDLRLRKEKYVRKNLQPVFIFERNPIRKKKNFRELQRVGDVSLLEYIAKSNMSYLWFNV